MRNWMLTAALVVGTLVYGCGKQGEGERCNTENNDEDCADGLTCVTRVSIEGAVCCPNSGATALACLDEAGTTTSTTTGGGGMAGSGGATASGSGGSATSGGGGNGGAGGTSTSSTTTTAGSGGAGGSGGSGGN